MIASSSSIATDPMSSLVSIIIPCYNAELWVGEAIRSALNQTYSPVEVIVIDDGSTDRSLEVIKSFGHEIRWETGQNLGGGRARNRGFALSAGGYIQFLDADDYLLPAKLERQMRVISNSDADVVYEDCQLLFESAAGRHKWGPREISGEPAEMLEIFLDYNSVTPPCVFLFSRSMVERAGGWDEKLTSAQDTDFYVRVALAGARWIYTPGCQSVYRRPAAPTVSSRDTRATAGNLISVFKKAETKLLHSGRLVDVHRRAIARSCLLVARAHINEDAAWSSMLMREALRLSPSIVEEQSRKYRLSARLLGISRVESLRALKRRGTRWLRHPVRTLKNGLHWLRPYRLPILLYHNVGPLPVEDPYGLTVAPEQFERQMQWLVSRGYETIWPSDWLAARKEGKPLPRNPILLTFDDGYAEMAEYALPVLRRHGLKAAVYVVTKRLGLTNTWDEAIGHPTMPLMTAEQVGQLAGQGIELGSHSRTHPHLTSLSEAQLTDEIEGSREDLQSLLGIDVVTFAYPYGDGADGRAIREHLSRTYKLGLTVWPGCNPIETNPFELRRLTILPSDSLQDFDSKLRFEKTLASRVRELLTSPLRTAARLSRRSLGGERLGQ